jgi:Actinobacteria/chloroflexi VLRF1 release factor
VRPSGPTARTVTIDGDRLVRWVEGFGARHRDCEIARTATGLVLIGGDGEHVEVTLPYLPWAGSTVDDAVAHLGLARRTLVLLVRRGGYACVVVDTDGGAGRVSDSKVGSRHVQGRTAAGGWSQQRFARRRQKQTDELVARVSDVAARLLLPALDDAMGPAQPATERRSVWLATGGDKPLVTEVLGDVRLQPIAGLPRAVHLAVGDPDRALVAALPSRLLQVRITVVPAGGGAA